MDHRLSAKELSLVLDTGFLLAKVRIMATMEGLLSDSKEMVAKAMKGKKLPADVNTAIEHGRIFRGENYQHLPYMVLDHPRHFTKDSIFAFRTMFWWGNEFSCTLHLQGKHLERYRDALLSNSAKLKNRDLHICVNNTPWQYYFRDDNYVPVKSLSSNELKEMIRKKNFIKLSRRLSLKKWKDLPSFSGETFETVYNTITR